MGGRLYYLHHLGSCACSSHGSSSNKKSGGGAGRCFGGKQNTLPMAGNGWDIIKLGINRNSDLRRHDSLVNSSANPQDSKRIFA
jgi:hypothetical protein